MKIDCHIHTHHSPDSMMRPARIIELARARGLDGIVVCDHDTIAGGLACAEINDDPTFAVIIAAEIRTTAGDITGIHLTQEIKSRDPQDVCAEIHDQGGKTILNHPFEAHDLSKIDLDGIDFIEAYNGRLSPAKNQKALKLAHQYGKPITAGSDAHIYAEIAGTYTVVNDTDLCDQQDISYQQTKRHHLLFSQWIRGYKTRSLRPLLGSSIHYVRDLVR